MAPDKGFRRGSRRGLGMHGQDAGRLEHVQRELMQLFQKYKGDDCVYLQLMGSRKLIKTTPNFWVNSEAPGFAEDVVKILGENCVVKKD